MQAESSLKALFQGKSVLVTGGTGSIGSSIVKELLALEPKVIRILSRDEGKHFQMQEYYRGCEELRYLVGDIRDLRRLDTAMKNIDIVFHAAALKHVPLCEYNPFEAVQTNVVGTQNVIQTAVDRKVSRLVMISTDKAMTPVNTMGASKLLAEKLVAAADSWNPGTAMCCVRFGNVVGSRGSVIPTMIQSILRHQEVCITDPDMTRFFMTIQDAVGLTLRAAEAAQGGEVFIFKMPAILLRDLVQVVIDETCKRANLASSTVQKRIIGIRPGEKMHEGLFSEDEVVRAVEGDNMFTVHSLGRYAKKRQENWGKIDTDLLWSDKSQKLSQDQIRQLLERAKVWDEFFF